MKKIVSLLLTLSLSANAMEETAVAQEKELDLALHKTYAEELRFSGEVQTQEQCKALATARAFVTHLTTVVGAQNPTTTYRHKLALSLFSEREAEDKNDVALTDQQIQDINSMPPQEQLVARALMQAQINRRSPQFKEIETIDGLVQALDSRQAFEGRNSHFSNIPSEIGNFYNLILLNFDKNQLSSVPTQITQLTKLEEVSLANNQFTTFPTSVLQLPKLKVLTLSNNKIAILSEKLASSSLERLDLDSNEIAELPSEFCLPSLTVLDLGRNKISAIPEEFNAPSLKFLDVSSNELIHLPKCIGNLTKLSVLNLCLNQISKLPDEIGNLNSLEALDIGCNKLTDLPATIGNLTQLQQLLLRLNQFTSACLLKLVGLSKLKRLELSSNPLGTLPAELFQLSSLTTLQIGHNQLSQLPPEIANLTLLTELVASNNQLQELPTSITQLTNLQLLNVVSNQLTTVPDQLFTTVQKLYLEGNPVAAQHQPRQHRHNIADLLAQFFASEEIESMFSSGHEHDGPGV